MRAMGCVFAFAFAACGPIQSGALLVDAQAELSAAQTAQADKQAPFEYVAAEEYLHKAREEQSYAEYERAIDFATKSRDCARVARSRAEAAMRQEIAGGAAIDPAPVTKARCQPGPNRTRPMLDADQEPVLKKAPAPAPGAAQKKPAKPENSEKKREAEPKDPVLPEGDQ